MANELIASWGPADLRRNTSVGYDSRLSRSQVGDGAFDAIAFPKNDNIACLDVVRIPGNATLTTGIKVDLVCIDDGKEAFDLGKDAKFAVTVKKLVSGTDTLDVTASGGTETAGTVTLAATSGVVKTLTISVPNAALDSAAAGDTIAIRFRRLGSDAADTLQGRVLVLRATAYAY